MQIKSARIQQQGRREVELHMYTMRFSIDLHM